jgi:hypothetical protein
LEDRPWQRQQHTRTGDSYRVRMFRERMSTELAIRPLVKSTICSSKVSGRVTYAVMSFGGFLGLGHSHYPIPWAALKYDTNLGGYRTGITEGRLRDAPEFSDDSWEDRDWEARTHEHYGVPGYWGTGA